MVEALASEGEFVCRHIGPSEADLRDMLAEVGVDSFDALVEAIVPASIRLEGTLAIGGGDSEQATLRRLGDIARKNKTLRSLVGQGYYDCITPGVILRNIFENPGWYTAYTPYQAEIAQGRLEALVNFQTMVSDLTGLSLSNASLLDEATAAAEAMAMCRAASSGKRSVFFVANDCHPQTIDVMRTRAEPIGIDLRVGAPAEVHASRDGLAGVLLQYPSTDGIVVDHRATIEAARASGALVVMAVDLLAMTLLTPPGELGADIAIGSAQRFGVPLGCGGPHAAFLATKDEYKRLVPGRIIGVSKDAAGRVGYRLALQTREQHIRRDRVSAPSRRSRLDQIDRALAGGIRVSAWTFDELYGRDGKFLDGLQSRRQVFIGEIPGNFHGWVQKPMILQTGSKTSGKRGRPRNYPRVARRRPSCEVRNLVKYSPVFREQTWQPYRIKDTDKGPEVWEVKWGHIPGARTKTVCRLGDIA